jgi:hypothetical protein
MILTERGGSAAGPKPGRVGFYRELAGWGMHNSAVNRKQLTQPRLNAA